MESQENVPHTELLRVGNFDVLVNGRQSSVNNEGLIFLKKKIIDDLASHPGDKPLLSWGMGRNGKRIAVDNINNPTFVAKEKWITPDSFGLKRAINIGRNTSLTDQIFKNEMYATDSLMNEIQLSRQIKTIVSSDEVQKMFKSAGIDSIDFVEPLLGIIDRKSGHKTMIYRHVKGSPLDRDEFPIGSKESVSGILDGIHKLKDIIRGNGIEPCDLSDKQFLIDRNQTGTTLHLIDIEMYYRTKVPEERVENQIS